MLPSFRRQTPHVSLLCLALLSLSMVVTPRPAAAMIPKQESTIAPEGVDQDPVVQPASPDAGEPTIAFVEPFAAPMLYTSWQSDVFGVGPGDFDGDGNLDLAVAEYYNVPSVGPTGGLAILMGNGDGSFQPPVRHRIGLNAIPHGTLVRDFDKDGEPDVLIDVENQSRVLFYKGNPDGTFRAPRSSTTVVAATRAATADLNGDTILDLVLAAFSARTVVVMMGVGDGSFQPPVQLATANRPVQDIALADLDGDADVDILASCWDRYLCVYLNNGSGVFPASATEYNLNVSVHALHAGNFDGNPGVDALLFGLDDIILVSGLGNGGFVAPPPPAQIIRMAAGTRWFGDNTPFDLNGDGKHDLLTNFAGATKTLAEANGVGVALGNGAGQFTLSRYVLQPYDLPWPSLDTTAASAMTAGDFNKDGLLDLAIGSVPNNLGGPGGISILLATAPGLYRAPRAIQVSGYLRDSTANTTALADFTGDNKLDLATLDTIVSGGELDISVAPGLGDGTFGAAIPSGMAGGQRASLAVADFDKDNKRDLVRVSTTNNKTFVGYGTGTGTFTPTRELTVTASFASPIPRFVATGDLNGDTYPDLATVVAFAPNSEIELFLYDGGATRTFTRVATRLPLSPIDANEYALAVADMDKDNKADIVAWGGSGGAPDRMLFFKGAGTGAFAAPVVIGAASAAVNQIRIIDLNGDGNRDIVAPVYVLSALPSTGGLYIQLGNGNGTFQAAQFRDVGKGAWQVDLADLNGDAKLDAAITFAPGFYNEGFTVLAGIGDGTFGSARRYAAGSADADGVHLGDLNGDSRPDAVVAWQSDSGRFTAAALINRNAPAADLGMKMTQQPANPSVGDPLTYTIIISNTGSAAAQNVTLRNPIRPGYVPVGAQPTQGACTVNLAQRLMTCALGTLASGATATIRYVVNPQALIGLWNTATVHSTTHDPATTNNGATVGNGFASEIVVDGDDTVIMARKHNFTVRFANFYNSETVQNAVVLVDLPGNMDFVSAGDGGIFFAERNQVFWKVGDVAPGSGGALDFTVQIPWGVTDRSRFAMPAMWGGTNTTNESFDIQDYLAYIPIDVSGTTELSLAQSQAIVNGNAQAKALYEFARAQGFGEIVTALKVDMSDASSSSRHFMVDLSSGVLAAVILNVTPEGSFLERFTGTEYQLFDENGGMRYQVAGLSSAVWQGNAVPKIVGAAEACEPSVDAEGNIDVSAGLGCQPTREQCIQNCLLAKAPEYILTTFNKTANKISSGVKAAQCIASGDTYSDACIEFGYDMAAEVGDNLAGGVPVFKTAQTIAKCLQECDQDPDKYVCSGDKKECVKNVNWVGSRDAVATRKCINNCYYELGGPAYTFCDTFQCSLAGGDGICVGGECHCIDPDGYDLDDPNRIDRFIVDDGTVRTGKDPNDKAGPEQAFAGQEIRYTINYENVGGGPALGVYVMDTLDANLDATTLVAEDGGNYIVASRTIFWSVGNLAPGGKGAVHFRIKVKNVPVGATITNKATVVFPSSLEFTDTNIVLTTVGDVAAESQYLTTPEDVALPITLKAVAPGNATPAYSITNPPLNGILSGAPPNLTYTPAAGFEGSDSFEFIASASNKQSAPALVHVQVTPSQSDKTPPQVLWTAPDDGAAVAVETVRTLESGYLPLLSAQMSEPIDTATVNASTVLFAVASGQAASGQAVTGTASFDGTSNQIHFTPGSALAYATEYDITLTQGIKDTSGNALAAPHTWSVHTYSNSALNVTPAATYFAGAGSEEVINFVNTGSATLASPAASLTGAQASHFTVVEDACSGQPLIGGGVCAIRVEVKAGAPTGAQAELRLQSGAALATGLLVNSGGDRRLYLPTVRR